MNPRQAKAALPIITALAEGRTIQFLVINGSGDIGAWDDVGEVFGDVIASHPDRYRIKPEPRVRPWTADEVPVGKVVRFKSEPTTRKIITMATHDGFTVVGGSTCRNQYLLDCYTMDDGSPCGVTE